MLLELNSEGPLLVGSSYRNLLFGDNSVLCWKHAKLKVPGERWKTISSITNVTSPSERQSTNYGVHWSVLQSSAKTGKSWISFVGIIWTEVLQEVGSMNHFVATIDSRAQTTRVLSTWSKEVQKLVDLFCKLAPRWLPSWLPYMHWFCLRRGCIFPSYIHMVYLRLQSNHFCI